MSRAFVKDDADNERILVPQRAPLPDGTPNLVTTRGLAQLHEERSSVRAELARLHALGPDEPNQARDVTAASEQLLALEDRLASAKVMAPSPEPPVEVGFGTTVTVRTLDGRFAGEHSSFTIVGVDEADPLEGLVAFTAPTAEAVSGHRVGDTVHVRAGGKDQRLEVVSIRSEPL